MHYLKFTLNLKDFNSEAFNPVYMWNSQERKVELSLKSTLKQSINIRNQKLIISKGQEFNILNSKKTPLEKIRKFLEKENIIIENTISLNNKDEIFSIITAQKNVKN